MNNYPGFNNSSNSAPGYFATSPAREASLIQRVSYLLVTALLVTALAASWAVTAHLSPALFLPIALGTFGCVIGISFTRRQPMISLALLYVLSALEGLLMGPLLGSIARGMPNGALIIGQAAGLSALLMAGLGTYVWISNKDFGGLGKFLFWGLIGLLVVGLLSLFVHMGGMGYLIYCIAGAALFVGFTLYDFSNIKKRFGPEDAVMATVQLYLDFINLFWFLLQILLMFSGGGSSRRDN